MSIDDALLAEAKRLALVRHCSLGEVFTEALRQLMMARRPAKAQNPTRLTTFKGKGIISSIRQSLRYFLPYRNRDA